MIYNNILEMIGNTPVLKLDGLSEGADIYLKLEGKNPGGSIKDRAALSMIENAEKEGRLKRGMTIIEPTSGNTGIGLAMIGRIKGYKVLIIMPDTMSVERRNIIKAYGAELILTDGKKGMKGAIERANELVEANKDYFMAQQFNNHDNTRAHYENTAEEIIRDFKHLDAFLAGVGTGGTISGVGKRLKEEYEDIKIIGVEPSNSPVLSGGQPGPHKIQGIGAGFITEIYDKDAVDEIVKVEDERVLELLSKISRQHGLFLGISAAANILASIEVANRMGKNKKILTIAPDNGEKYVSLEIY